MDNYISMTKINNLFWLGRYAARVDATLRYLAEWYDTMLDGLAFDYEEFCYNLEIPCPYKSHYQFMRSYVFSKKNPDSIRSAAELMLGNGMVLRETIGSDTLSYLQMTVYAIDRAAITTNPWLGFQKVCDLLMAFAGRCDIYIEQQDIRDIIKCGACIERISLYLCFGYPEEALLKDLQKLMTYTARLSLPVSLDAGAIAMLQAQKYSLEQGGDITVSRRKLQKAAESLFGL